MICPFVLLCILFLVKHFGTLLTFYLMNIFQVLLELSVCFKHFRTMITFEQMIQHMHRQ